MTSVFLEFQIGTVLFLKFFCHITKMMRVDSGLDLLRQRFKAGLAGFCYPTCSRARKRKQLSSDQNRMRAGKGILFL